MSDVTATPGPRPTAVVTGAGRGQGAAHVHTMLELGFVVHAIDLTFTSECAEHPNVHQHTMDITDEQAWLDLRSELSAATGPLRVLVNNAGIIHVADVEVETRADFERILTVNVTGAFLAVRSLWSLLAAAGNSSVINVASIFGVHGAAGYLSYSTSKSALIGMTKTLALEGAPHGIRVNAIAPGTVLTSMRDAEPESGSAIHLTPMGRGASPKEISRVVGFLAGDQSSFMTGAILPVDGGYSAR